MRFGLPTDVGQYEAVKGGFQSLEPGVYLGVVKKVDPEYKSAEKKTPAIEVILEAREGTQQKDGSTPAKRQATHRIWLPVSGDDKEKMERKYGQVRYFLENCFGLNASAGEFNTEDIEGREIVFRTKLGDVITRGKHVGKRFTEVSYVRPAAEWAQEWAQGPAVSDGIPAPVQMESSAPAEVNSNYSSSY